VTAETLAAVEEIRSAFPDCTVELREDGEGVIVLINPVDPGPPYVQRETWVGFRITYQYPYADVYPHFVRGDLARVDGAPLGEGLTPTSFENRPAVQISRRSNRLNPATDTAALKLTKVLYWLGNK
jgi:hypothetical protein